jgi:hypothetical protein
MKMMVLTLLILCIGGGSSFNGATSRVQNQSSSSLTEKLKKQKFLFEKSYTNFAWGYQHAGIYVDNQGKVYQYSYGAADKPWSPKQIEAITEQELEEKYSHGKTLLGTIDPQVLFEKYQLIAQASKGRYSRHVQRGADQGSLGTSCYVYNEATGCYKEIDLQVSGDWSYENLSPAARKLANWLDSLKDSFK